MLLKVEELQVGYAKRVVVHRASFHAETGEIVTIIGHNGAGKTTTLKGLFGHLKPAGGRVLYSGSDITGRSPMDNVRDGITYTPQDRYTFPDLSVRENMELGAYTAGSEVASRIEQAYDVFPILKARAWQRARTLSGGERRMLGLAMALITRPRLMLLDEPSLGLSPVLVQALFTQLRSIRAEQHTTIIVVEQNVKQALGIADRAYVMKMGRIILEEDGASLLSRGQWWDLF